MPVGDKIYRSLFEIAPVGISLIDSNRNIIEFNKTLPEILKISKSDLLSGKFRDRKYVHSDGTVMKPEEFPGSIAIRQKRTVKKVEIGIVLKNGETIWTEVSARPFGPDKKLAVVITEDITFRKNLQKRLFDSEEKFRSLFENSGEAILLTNPDGSVYSANPEACKMYGMSEKEICRRGRSGLIDINDPRYERGLKERSNKGRFRGEINQVKKDGTIIPTEVISTIFSDKSGNEMTSTIVRDLSDMKKAEKELLLKGEILKNITEGINIVRLADAKIVYTNSRFDEIFGYEPGELMGENVSVLNAAVEKDPESTVHDILGSLGTNREWHGEVLNRKKDGSAFWSYANVSVFEHEDFGKVCMTVQSDITDRKNAERKIYLASLYTRSLIETSLDPLVTISAEGKITDVNKATEKITGIHRNKLIGSDFSDYFTEPEKAREGYMKVFTKGFVKNYPLTILHKSSRTTPVLYNATLYRDNYGVVQGVFAAARDMTLQYKMEEDLRKSGEVLEKLNKHLHDVWENEKSQIALNLHDDLGQKFTALMMDLSWLKSRMGIQSAPVRKKLNEMKADIDETIEEIKEISTLLRPAILFDLGLIPAIISQLNRFEKQSGISCSFTHFPEDIKIDHRLSLILYRIFQESLTNIARHSKAASAVVSLRLSNNKITLCINDNGNGINKSKIDSLSSMGIIGMKERSNMVHGHISIKGEKGKGTTIRVTIPLNKSGKDD
ncbi:MAG TPA: PAS domain S-box protein [Bacteroidales bacterium]|nr:PAS domain S-box protein [Bacteroidales bacterium]